MAPRGKQCTQILHVDCAVAVDVAWDGFVLWCENDCPKPDGVVVKPTGEYWPSVVDIARIEHIGVLTTWDT